MPIDLAIQLTSDEGGGDKNKLHVQCSLTRTREKTLRSFEYQIRLIGAMKDRVRMIIS